MYKHITPRYHRQQLMTSIISGLADEPSSTNLTKVIMTTSTTQRLSAALLWWMRRIWPGSASPALAERTPASSCSLCVS